LTLATGAIVAKRGTSVNGGCRVESLKQRSNRGDAESAEEKKVRDKNLRLCVLRVSAVKKPVRESLEWVNPDGGCLTGLQDRLAGASGSIGTLIAIGDKKA
jgi:hypothetical protein